MSTLSETIDAVAGGVAAAAGELNRLDGVAGDGDLGVTAAAAAKALQALLPELDGLDVAAALRRCGSEVARKAPSTCGTLLATALLRAGRAAGEPGCAGAPNDAARLAIVLAAAQTGIQERGKAAPGDKTLLDALAPAVQTVERAAAEGAGLAKAVQRAAGAARAGAEATKTLRARAGRAGWLADRSQGHVDAGAHLVALLFESAARHLGERAQPG